MSLISCNMIRKESSEQELYQPREEKTKEDRVSATKIDQNATRNVLPIEDESKDELYGLALILRNTEDSSASLSVQPNNEESSREDATPESSENEEDKFHSRCCQNLNRRLVIYKMFYFFFFSALGSLFPYLAVFYKQLWLSAHETGLLIGIRPLILSFVTPMWGIIADVFKKSKVIFTMSLVAWLVSHYSLSLVSPVFHLGPCKDNGTMGIIQEILENKTTSVKNSTQFTTHQKQKKPITVNTGNASEHWFEVVGGIKTSNSSKRTTINLRKQKSQTQVKSSYSVDDNQNMFYNTSNLKDYKKLKESAGKNHSLSKSRVLHRTDSETVNTQRLGRNIKNSELSMSNDVITLLNLDRDRTPFVETKLLNSKASKLRAHNKLRRLAANSNLKTVISESDFVKLFHNSSDVTIEEFTSQVNRERIERVFDSLNMAGEYPWPLDTVANYELTQTSYDWKNPANEHVFLILFVISCIGALIGAPAINLADTATLQNLGNRPEDYGKQRLWGALGWGLAATIVGASLGIIQESNNCNNPLSVDYLPCFYVFACLMGMALLIGVLFEFDEKTSQETGICQGLATFIDCRYICLILTILFCGCALGFIQAFLFWHLQDLGGSQLLFSIITAIHCTSEVTVYCFSGFFIKWLGHHQLLYVGLSCYAIRFFCYAFIKNAWTVLPLELLHGFSTAAVWSAAVAFVGLIPGAPATVQAILGGVHWGLGQGVGGVVGGLLITYAGATTSFLIIGVISLVDLILFICLNNMEYFNCFQWSKEVSTRSPCTLQEDKVYDNDEADYDDLY